MDQNSLGLEKKRVSLAGGINTLKHLMTHEKYWCRKKVLFASVQLHYGTAVVGW